MTLLKGWVRRFDKQGPSAFEGSYTNYPIEFKMDVLTYMNETGASTVEAAAVFNIPSSAIVRKWRQLFFTQGIDALQPKKKGRQSMKNKREKDKQTVGSYLSPVLDLYNGEIIAYHVEHRPIYPLVSKMLDNAFKKLKDGDTPILHFDQGWHYQMAKYQVSLKQYGIVQSMSRKGNCLDNAVMENFFGLLKSELLYLHEFESMDYFKKELVKYIDYYNHKRIKAKLKGMSPVEYRTHALEAA